MDRRVLVADDEETICCILEHELTDAGFEVVVARDGKCALELLEERTFDVAVIDINMPLANGFRVLEGTRSGNGPPPIIIMITAYGTIESAVRAMQMGSSDYITKPFDCEVLVKKINQLLSLRDRAHTGGQRTQESGETGFWGNSSSVLEIRAIIGKIKDLKSNVLITGESGTGKGVVAKRIHSESQRARLPFVHVDCASIQPNLIESILFGHEKGAFTGAVATQRGKFELAQNGTIFLDEIGSLPPNLQSRLLIVLQERVFSRIGSGSNLFMNARIIAATNENLEQMVRNGTFREDLYYRLNIIRIHMPTLRERPEDIKELSTHFLKRHAERNGKTIVGFNHQVQEIFRRYEWPGNIRELENAVECAVVLAEGDCITPQDIPLYVTERYKQDKSLVDVAQPVSLAEQELMSIISSLEKYGGHREKTAQALGISRRTLQYKLKKYGLIIKD